MSAAETLGVFPDELLRTAFGRIGLVETVGSLADSYEVKSNGCWYWTRQTDREGYGRIWRDHRHWGAHRYVYTIAIGPIPEGMTVDHICFNTSCVNPDHLQLLTNVENAGRKRSALSDTCGRGHKFTPENTARHAPDFRRRCRKCKNANWLARKARLKAAKS